MASTTYTHSIFLDASHLYVQVLYRTHNTHMIIWRGLSDTNLKVTKKMLLKMRFFHIVWNFQFFNMSLSTINNVDETLYASWIHNSNTCFVFFTYIIITELFYTINFLEWFFNKQKFKPNKALFMIHPNDPHVIHVMLLHLF